MATLNRGAARAMLAAGPHAATDVTGFGLTGHLHGMLKGSGVRAEIDAARVPFLKEVLDLAAVGCVPGGTRANLRYVDPHMDWNDFARSRAFGAGRRADLGRAAHPRFPSRDSKTCSPVSNAKRRGRAP
jgi:hypothetical protein